MNLVRVFPRLTKATPRDTLAFIGDPPLFLPSCIDEVHVSCTFSWDIPEAERLARAWEHIAPVKIGGPAMGTVGEDFTPGRYIGYGYTITSRGCPNRCWFCQAWKRDGNEVRELPIRDGWNVLDDNLLACSDEHIRAVFAMLARQHYRAEFTGGLEAKRLKMWHVEELKKVRAKQIFFAYDTPDDWEPLAHASVFLREAGFTRNHLRCHVLIGWPRDTFESAEKRLRDVAGLGMFPSAMLYRGPETKDKKDAARDWRVFQRAWQRPAQIARSLGMVKEGRVRTK